MRTTVVLLALLVVMGAVLAQAPATHPNLPAPEPVRVKIYTGLPGSEDYHWGYVPRTHLTDAWMVHSEMPTGMMDNAVASNATHVYAAAGYSTGHVLYRWPIAGGAWQTMAPCPLDLCTGGAAIIGDTFYYCGGYKDVMNDPADTLYKYSITGDNWTSAPGPFADTGYNWSPTVTACRGKLYYMSGCATPGSINPTRQVWRYTPGAGWTQVASMNQGRVFAHAGVYHDTIWVAGGVANNVGLTHTEFYDPVADTWLVNNTVFPQLPESRWGAASGVAGTKMFVASGVQSDFSLSDTAFYFDFGSRTWSVEDGIPLRVYRTAGCGTADYKAMICGGSRGGFLPTDTCQYSQISGPPLAQFLWLYSDFGAPDTTLAPRLRALGDSVVYMDVQTTTPTISQLLPYTAVGAHSNYPYADPTALGNVLAQYVDSGGGVVLGNFSFVVGWAMGGQLMTGNYATINPGSNQQAVTTLGWFNAAHPVMSGVTSVGDLFAGGGSFAAESVARWADGRPYVAVSANHKVVGVNSYPGIYSVPERNGDWALVFHNALRYVGGLVGVEEFDPLQPALNVRLEAAPVPARGRLVVSYATAGSGAVTIGIYDPNGRLVKTLCNGPIRSGVNTAVWDMTSDGGAPVATGVYFCKLIADGRSVTRKVVVE